MFIAITGTRLSGKSTVEGYLLLQGFISVQLDKQDGEIDLDIAADVSDPYLTPPTPRDYTLPSPSFLSMNSPTTPDSPARGTGTLVFPSPSNLLDYVTENWRSNFVTTDLNSKILIDFFAKRPFFMLIHVEAPALQRYHRLSSAKHIPLEDFILQDDLATFGASHGANGTVGGVLKSSQLRALSHLIKVNVNNSFETISALYSHLDSLDIFNSERMRPQWDTYFMTLADLASQRSNCMKRRVGAILVRENRIIATGYNGTPRGLPNCYEGGCSFCNGTPIGDGASECLCLHAEENALLEVGRERVGSGATLYCNTCPCLKCTIKIIQCGVKSVVYNLSYKVDEASAKLFSKAGVELRRHCPPSTS